MSFTVLDIPESHDELASWLEQRLVSLDLADVVAGLEVFGGPTADASSLSDLLGDRRQSVLDTGLAALNGEQWRRLLNRPRLLLELQELVLVDGGPYWQRLPVGGELRRLVDAGWENVDPATTQQATPAVAAGGGTADRRSPWTRVLSIAALVLIGLFGWWQFQRPTSGPNGWGWDKPGALATNLTAREYLHQLADGAHDWFNKRPEDSAGLRNRLEQFRHGCDTLLAAPHTPLAEADREWLQERCRTWRGKIDGHLAALESGATVLEVRDAADRTVNKLIFALEERSTAVG